MKIYEKSNTILKWQFFQYVSLAGRRSIDDWRKSMPQGSRRADMDVFLRDLTKKSEWEFPDVDSLKGKKYAGLSELRWKSEGVQHRIFGYTAAPDEYVMLIGCTHRSKKYDPPDAMDTAVKRRQHLINQEAIIVQYQLILGR